MGLVYSSAALDGYKGEVPDCMFGSLSKLLQNSLGGVEGDSGTGL